MSDIKVTLDDGKQMTVSELLSAYTEQAAKLTEAQGTAAMLTEAQAAIEAARNTHVETMAERDRIHAKATELTDCLTQLYSAARTHTCAVKNCGLESALKLAKEKLAKEPGN